MRRFDVVVLNQKLPGNTHELPSYDDPNHRFLLTLFSYTASLHRKEEGEIRFKEKPVASSLNRLKEQKSSSKMFEIRNEVPMISFSGDVKAYCLNGFEPIELGLWNCRELEEQSKFFLDHIISTANAFILLFPRSDKTMFQDLDITMEKYKDMMKDGVSIFLIGWQRMSQKGRTEHIAVSKDDIEDKKKQYGALAYYDIYLQDDCRDLTDVMLLESGFKGFVREKQVKDYLEQSNTKEVYDAITSTIPPKQLTLSQQQRKRKNVPPLVPDCVSFLEAYGVNTSKIFCSQGSESVAVINSLYTKYLKGKKVILTKIGTDAAAAHNVAGLLKAFLRHLSEPLLTHELYDQFLAIDDVPIGFKRAVIDVTVTTMPTENRYILLLILQLLSKVVDNQERTHVDCEQLARTIAPCLICVQSNFVDDNAKQLKLAPVLQLLIDNSEYLVKEFMYKTAAQVQTNLNEEFQSKSSLSTFLSKETMMGKTPHSLTPRRKYSTSFANKSRTHIINKLHRRDDDKSRSALTVSGNSYARKDSDKGILPEHQYARDGNLVELQQSLQDHPFLLKARDDLGNTLLHYAAMCAVDSERACDMAKFLLHRDPSMQFTQRWDDGKTPLHVAIDSGRSGKDVVRVFMERVKDKENELIRRTKNGRTVLHYAARNDCLESVTILASCLSSRLSDSLHLQDSSGCTPLHYAARNDNFGSGGPAQQSQLVFLIKKLASPLAIESRDSEGQTPLHYAVQRKADSSVRAIIPFLALGYSTVLGADRQGRTPLHIAVRSGSADAVDMLLKIASSLNMLKLALTARDVNGQTALHYAAEQHAIDVVGRVSADEEATNLADYQGLTPLHLATRSEPKNNDTFNQIQVVTLLVNCSMTINVVDQRGKTPLHYVNSADMVQCLCSLGAMVNVIDFEGYTPYDQALEEKRNEVATALSNLGATKGNNNLGSSSESCSRTL